MGLFLDCKDVNEFVDKAVEKALKNEERVKEVKTSEIPKDKTAQEEQEREKGRKEVMIFGKSGSRG